MTTAGGAQISSSNAQLTDGSPLASKLARWSAVIAWLAASAGVAWAIIQQGDVFDGLSLVVASSALALLACSRLRRHGVAALAFVSWATLLALIDSLDRVRGYPNKEMDGTAVIFLFVVFYVVATIWAARGFVTGAASRSKIMGTLVASTMLLHLPLASLPGALARQWYGRKLVSGDAAHLHDIALTKIRDNYIVAVGKDREQNKDHLLVYEQVTPTQMATALRAKFRLSESSQKRTPRACSPLSEL